MMDRRKLSLLDDKVTERLMRKVVNPGNEDDLLYAIPLLDKDGKINADGRKILSAYPYFGSGDSTPVPFPSIIFAFVLALPEEMEHKRDPISSCFLNEERKDVIKLSELLYKAYKKEGIIKKDGEIELSSARSFISLSIPDRLSYILSSLLDKDERDMKKALGYISYVNGLEKNKLDSLVDDINASLHLDLTLELLEDLALVKEDNGLYTSRLLEKEESGPYTVSSDMTLTYPGDRDDEIYLIAAPLLSDKKTKRWTITKSSIKRALDSTLTPSDIRAVLSSYSSYPLPDNIMSNIESWEREYNRVKIVRGTVVTVDDGLSPLFDTDGIKEYIIEKLSPSSFLLESSGEDKWMKKLEDYGIVMLPKPKGVEFEVKEVEEKKAFSPLPPLTLLPTKRDIEWDKKEEEEYRASITNPFERLLMNEHLVFSHSDMLAYEERDGLEYQEKRELIHEALKDGSPVVIVDIKGKYRLVNPVALDGDILSTTDREYCVSSLWKVQEAPGVIRKKRDLDL